VTLTGLLVGGALLVSSRDRNRVRPLRGVLRSGIVTLCIAAAAFSFVGLVANRAVSDSAEALAAGDFPRAEAQARKATRWAPWSSEGWASLGQAQLQAGGLAAARASFRRALAKDPRDWSLWFYVASASTARERRAAARIAYSLNPMSPELAAVRRAFDLPGKGE
jgi:Flp pilus assembly protein TadD